MKDWIFLEQCRDQLEILFDTFERASLILLIRLSRPLQSISIEHEFISVCKVNSTTGELSALTLLLSNATCALKIQKK